MPQIDTAILQKPTVTIVALEDGFVRLTLSCSHWLWWAGAQHRLPQVGDHHDCLDCDMARMEQRGRDQRNAHRRALYQLRKAGAA